MTDQPCLDELLRLADQPGRPSLSPDQAGRLANEHLHLQRMAQQGMPIYGFNTEVGHRDGRARPPDGSLWRDVVASHVIGTGSPYPDHAARCIGLAKLMQWRSGGSGVSPGLFDHVVRVCTDPAFLPRVPSSESYSCGDVIPATHWAVQVLEGSPGVPAYSERPEVMPLINGSFVHVGLAASVVPGWGQCIRGWGDLSAWWTDFMATDLHGGPQAAVSVRAAAQVEHGLTQAFMQFTSAIDEALSQPSCNPLIDLRSSRVVSQASFLALPLSLAQSAFIEAILLTMWASVSRVQFLLGNQHPLADRIDASGLALIQHPKRMMALLERARLRHGRRTFASGGQTSNGIEDLWSFGLLLCESLMDLQPTFEAVCTLERSVYDEVDRCLHRAP